MKRILSGIAIAALVSGLALSADAQGRGNGVGQGQGGGRAGNRGVGDGVGGGRWANRGQAAEGQRQGKHHRKHRRAGMRRAMEKLNLTDAQKEQMRSIRENTRSQHEAIRNNQNLTDEQRREQLRTLHQNTRTQMQNVLTPEQRQQLQDWKKDHKQKHKGRGGDDADDNQ